MKKQKVRIKTICMLVAMLFGLFFWGGNLIFPVHMDKEAGSKVALANLGV